MLPVMFLFLILGMLISYIIMIHFKKKKEVGLVNIWEFHSPNVWIWNFYAFLTPVFVCILHYLLCLVFKVKWIYRMLSFHYLNFWQYQEC